MNEFTFGVLTYNQENEIISTLNSIKFQVKEYGANIKCSIIITDDCSKDSTVNVCQKWLHQNMSLFSNVELKTNDKNIGTVKNYNYILGKIKSPFFKIIAGDDLIGHNNIFELAFSLKQHTLLCGLKIMFRGNALVIDKKAICRQFYLANKNLTRKNNLNLFKLGFIISTPQTLYDLDLYNDSNAIELNSTFKLFEDNPTWYSMLKNVDDIKVRYLHYPIVLYRLNENSVSNSKTKVNDVFQDELHRLYDIYIEEGNWLDLLYFSAKKKGGNKLFNLSKYVDTLFDLKCILFSLSQYSKYKRYAEELENIIEAEKNHLQYILNQIGEAI